MRKLFWTFSGLAVSAAGFLLSRGPLGAEQPRGWIDDSFPTQARPAPTAPAQVPAMPPRSPFAVTAKSGAWMICAAHYTGPYAPRLADQVIRQLRDRRINCYLFNYADEHRREENAENMARLRAHPDGGFRPRFTRVEEQCAVLIGGFKDMESARKALPTVKKLTAPKVLYPNGVEACQHVMEYGERTDEKTSKSEKNPEWAHKVNPFETSFVIRNPAAPRDQVAMEKRVDPLWKKLNVHEPYSLLKCKKSYTILVKCYQGGSEMQSQAKPTGGGGILAKVGLGGSGPDVMQCVGNQAHALAKFLRNYQFEAYVLHTRQGSLVTIGGFDTLNDEEMRQMQQKLGTLKLVPGGGATAGPSGQEGVFDLLPNPMPMPIPKL